ncbi:MAG: tyrosine--tRNA ligase [Candidatus Moraniibacteriota bacterium]|nr:MAG: tyrosine--tRNA ligase [Candidatus Moranbacteria bacterium]
MTQEEKKASIDEIFARGTIVEILPSEELFRKRLLEEKLKFYIGFDATSSTLHLSHAKNIMLLEKFRRLGHEVILLFGDFTAMIGDPTGGSLKRKQLTKEEVKENVESWKKQIIPLMDFETEENPPCIRYNSDWLSQLRFDEVIGLASNFTVQQMLERDMFEKRMQKGDPVFLHEFLYPLMQGYDSVVLDVDVELCGTDQIFNALSGRTLLKKCKNKEKFVVAVTLMEDPQTGELMSKSKGTGVFLNADSRNMFGQIMSQGDGMIEILFKHCTAVSLKEISEIMEKENFRDAKLRLAQEIVKIFYGLEIAEKEKEYFIETFSKKHINAESLDILAVASGSALMDILVSHKFAESKSDARRKIEQGGVSLGEEKCLFVERKIELSDNGEILRIGKKHFVRLNVSKE